MAKTVKLSELKDHLATLRSVTGMVIQSHENSVNKGKLSVAESVRYPEHCVGAAAELAFDAAVLKGYQDAVRDVLETMEAWAAGKEEGQL